MAHVNLFVKYFHCYLDINLIILKLASRYLLTKKKFIMKKLILILFIAAAFVGCSKEGGCITCYNLLPGYQECYETDYQLEEAIDFHCVRYNNDCDLCD